MRSPLRGFRFRCRNFRRVREASFIHEVAQLCGLSAVQLQAILDGSFEAIEELEKSELVRVHTDVVPSTVTYGNDAVEGEVAFVPEE